MARKIAVIEVDLEARTGAFKTAMAEATTTARQSAAQMRQQMMEARGGFMLLGEEIGVRVPRHLQTFLSKLPGVAPAMSAAFSGIAVVALGMLVVKAGEKVYHFFEEVSQAGRKMEDGFRGILGPMKLTNDALEVSNARLEIGIAKLEHKPQNNLKLALAEATEAADKLADSVDKDLAKVGKLLEEQGVSRLASAISGEQPTKDLTDKLASVRGEVQRISDEGELAAQKAKNDEDALKERANARLHILQFITEEMGKASAKMTSLQDLAQAAQKHIPTFADAGDVEGLGLNYSRSITAWREFSATLAQIKRGINDQDQELADKGRLASDEAGQRGAAERLKHLEAALAMQLAASTLGHAALVMEERNYWQEHIAEFTKGSDQYLAVSNKISDEQKQLNQQSIEMQKKVAESIGQTDNEFALILRKMSGTGDAAGKRQFEGLLNAQAKAAADADKFAVAMANQNAQLKLGAVNWEEQSGRISAAEAIQERMAVATQEFAEQETILAAEIKAQQTLSIISPDALEKVEQLTDELDKLRKARDRALGTLQGQQESMQWSHTFDDMLVKAQNAGLELRSIFKTAIDGVNNDLADLMTGKKANFKQVFENAAQSMGKLALNQIEAPLFAKLGLAGGKPDGSPGNPLYVTMSGSTASGGAGGAGGLSSIMSSLSGGVGGFFQKIMSFFGGFMAEGGALNSSSWYVAGEHGPEIVAGVNGRVFNSSEAQRLTGHGASYYIDARGANAADVEARVGRMLRAVHGSAVRTSLASMQEQARRRPLAG